MGTYQVQLYFLSSAMSRKKEKEKEKIKFDITHCYGFLLTWKKSHLDFILKDHV